MLLLVFKSPNYIKLDSVSHAGCDKLKFQIIYIIAYNCVKSLHKGTCHLALFVPLWDPSITWWLIFLCSRVVWVEIIWFYSKAISKCETWDKSDAEKCIWHDDSSGLATMIGWQEEVQRTMGLPMLREDCSCSMEALKKQNEKLSMLGSNYGVKWACEI